MILRILITGADGQLGRAIMLHKNPADCLFGYNSNECDIINLSKVSQIFENTKPNVVIHCAAYTSVDKAELEITKCKEVNIQGSINIAKACQNIGAKLVFFEF